MSRLLRLLTERPLTLIVSLPRNDVELGRAAIRGGADALKVHILIQHQAAKTKFGTFREEKMRLQEILQVAGGIPVGLVPGDERHPDEKEFQEIADLGFDFLDMRLHSIPSWMIKANGLGRIAAIEFGYSTEELMDLPAKGIDALEAAVVPTSEYGKSVTVGDLQHYMNISIASGLPIIVPSQRRISVRDIPFLADAKVNAVMIGAIVTGQTAESIEEVTQTFRQALDAFEV